MAEVQKTKRKLRYYSIPEDKKTLLKALADPTCKRCRGDGYSGFANGGAAANICKCAQEKAARITTELERQKARLEGKLAEEKLAQEIRDLEAKMTRMRERTLTVALITFYVLIVLPFAALIGWRAGR